MTYKHVFSKKVWFSNLSLANDQRATSCLSTNIVSEWLRLTDNSAWQGLPCIFLLLLLSLHFSFRNPNASKCFPVFFTEFVSCGFHISTKTSFPWATFNSFLAWVYEARYLILGSWPLVNHKNELSMSSLFKHVDWFSLCQKFYSNYEDSASISASSTVNNHLSQLIRDFIAK